MNFRTAGALFATVIAVSPALAQESTNKVAEQTDWSVFVETDPTECWSVTRPKSSVNTRDGRRVEVRRGETLLFVAFRPESDVEGEVSFTGGYPFADGSTVTMQVGDTSFELFTQGEWAWPGDAGADARVIEAMRGGAEAVLIGRSSRGTRTEDTFSLMGFTAALEEAEQRCTS